MYVSFCQKLKQEVLSLFLHTFVADIFFQAETTVPAVFFRPWRKCKRNFISKSFKSAIEEPPPNLEWKVINLQCTDILKGKYQETTVIEFYKCLLSDEYAQLKSYACGLISVFGSIYLCEKTFSNLKYVKSHYRSMLTDEHLQSFLMLRNGNFEHQLNKMLIPPNEFHYSFL